MKELENNELHGKKRMICYIPSSLNLNEFLIEHKPNFKYHLDNFNYILSLLTEIPANNKQVLNEYAFVPINAQTLQKKIRNYNHYIAYLIHHKIIESDNFYIAGEKSKGFRYTKKYSTKMKAEIVSKPSLLKNFNKKELHSITLESKYKNLQGWFNEDLKLDYPMACDYLNEQLKKDLHMGSQNAMVKYNASFLNANRLFEHSYYFIVDKNVNRLHTNLTNCKSAIRNFLTYNNQNLVSVDISNSQPLFSVALLNSEFYLLNTSNTTYPKNVRSYFQVNNNIKYIFNKIHSYIMLVNRNAMPTNTIFDEYIRIVESGDLYPYFKREYESITVISISSRKSLKEMIFMVLYSDNRFFGQNEAQPKRIFKKMFPEVYEVFVQLKRSDKTLLPRLLQKLESYTILDRIAKRIGMEEPQMPIYTIHDSIVCPYGMENYVSHIIREEIYSLLGIYPKIHFDYWKSENIM